MRPLYLLASLFLITPMVFGEGVEPRNQLPSGPTRVRGAATVWPVPWGLVALGGSTLRQLPKGKTEWEILHQVKGDNLYRVAGHESGGLLASWEKEDVFHLFYPRQNKHLTFPKPAKPSDEFRTFALDELYFSKDGTEAIVYMEGLTGSCVWTTVVYRYKLDGKSAPKMLLRQPGYKLHSSASLAVFGYSTNNKVPCDYHGCSPLSAVLAYEISGDKATQRTILAGEGDEYSIARMAGAREDGSLAMVIFDKKNVRHLLRWRPGEEKGRLFTLPKAPGYEVKACRLNQKGDVVEVWEIPQGRAFGLEFRRYSPGGEEKVTRLDPLPQGDPDVAPDFEVYGFRERVNGDFLLHWGDHLVLLSATKPTRALNLEPLLKRRNEWAGADIYIPDPEGLWIGIEVGESRDLVYLSLADIEKRARPLP